MTNKHKLHFLASVVFSAWLCLVKGLRRSFSTCLHVEVLFPFHVGMVLMLDLH